MGNFNNITAISEKRGGARYPMGLITYFCDSIRDSGLVDLGLHVYQFTWERGKGTTAWVKKKLDRGLANSSWMHMFKNAVIWV